MNILNLIRYKNLLIIAGTQFLFKYFLIDTFFKETALPDWQFILLVLATVCIAAAGNIINDIQDIEIDKINKPKKLIVGKHISEKTANSLYIILNIIGVIIGFYIANSIGKSGFAVIFVLISGLLYYYATTLKRYLIISNIMISTLVSLSILIIGLFDVLPMMNNTNEFLVKYQFKILLIYAAFAFFMTLLREIIKDIQDVDGDHANGINTLPIAIGKQRTARLIAVLGISVCFAVFYFVYIHLHSYTILVAYFLLGVIAPMLYLSFISWDAKKKKVVSFISVLLKIIMIIGVLSIIPIHYYVLKGF